MAFVLPELPYAKNAFGDVISEETFSYHHGKHHNAYVTKANELIPQAGLQGASLSQAIKAAKEQGKAGLFNQVGQVWNHSFYWLCLSPEKQAPTGKLLEMIMKAMVRSMTSWRSSRRRPSAISPADGLGWSSRTASWTSHRFTMATRQWRMMA